MPSQAPKAAVAAPFVSGCVAASLARSVEGGPTLLWLMVYRESPSFWT